MMEVFMPKGLWSLFGFGDRFGLTGNCLKAVILSIEYVAENVLKNDAWL